MLKQLERTLKATSDRTRLRILKMLQAGPLCVCEVVAVLGLSQSTVSKHLSILVNAGLIEDDRRGRWTLYALTASCSRGSLGGLLSVINDGLKDDVMIRADAVRLKSPRVRSLTQDCPVPLKGRSRTKRGVANELC